MYGGSDCGCGGSGSGAAARLRFGGSAGGAAARRTALRHESRSSKTSDSILSKRD